MSNNNQINNTSYYQLPNAKDKNGNPLFLEDFIWYKKLDFPTGSAVKYLFRAGKKDGESDEKDIKKAEHYIIFIATETGEAVEVVRARIFDLLDEANEWKGYQG